MNQVQNVRDILDAINSVKIRAKTALIEGDMVEYGNRMLDLIALEQCLVTQTEELLKEIA